MLRTFAAAAVAVSLIAGSAFAQTQTPAANAPTTTSQPAAKAEVKTEAKTTAVTKEVQKVKTSNAHMRKHVKHVRHAKHHGKAKHIVKHQVEKTRG